MKTDLVSSLMIVAVALYLGRQWLNELRRGNEKSRLRALPGGSPASLQLILAAIGGSLVILAIETGGEYYLDTSESQSNVSWSFLFVMIAAGFIEEIIFRGYLVIENQGRPLFLTGVIVVSALFSLGHVQYWLLWGDSSPTGSLALNLTAGSAWILFILFVNSLWFYAVRFLRPNSTRSLLPCIAAHISSNIGVFAIKLFQGHVVGII